jgi:hypothetical protein
MVSVIGLDAEKANALCKEATEKAGEGEIVVANYLCNGNYACRFGGRAPPDAAAGEERANAAFQAPDSVLPPCADRRPRRCCPELEHRRTRLKPSRIAAPPRTGCRLLVSEHAFVTACLETHRIS